MADRGGGVLHGDRHTVERPERPAALHDVGGLTGGGHGLVGIHTAEAVERGIHLLDPLESVRHQLDRRQRTGGDRGVRDTCRSEREIEVDQVADASAAARQPHDVASIDHEQGDQMPDKSPQKPSTKKPGKSLKEKAADKKQKQEQKKPLGR